ncbi:MAG: hypothetical protein FJ145_16390 [Deltaproteobacteria bacterium]|nr:hypothetical protein [Deltaproteobacteria bacterium]
MNPAVAYPLFLKALGFGLIWLSFVLVLAALLLSQRREYFLGEPYKYVITLAVAVLGLCAMIALGVVSAKSQSHQSIRSSFDRG